MSKNFIKPKAQGLKPKAKCLIIDDVKMMNLQTYRNTIVRHQYEKNLFTFWL
jgi:hypothetical protein